MSGSKIIPKARMSLLLVDCQINNAKFERKFQNHELAGF